MATAIVMVPILSCSQRSLVLVTVNAPEGVTGFSGPVTLVITANATEKTTFDKVTFIGGVYKAGVYLPSDMSGTVNFTGEVDQDNCMVATGTATATGISSGDTVSTMMDLSAIAAVCKTPDGGAGSSGTGGASGSGGSGTAGSRGTGGASTGIGGAKGSGGAIGSGGAKGSGGVIGTGGVIGSGGVVGTGGVGGGGGRGGSASGGNIGSGGAKGSGGLIGSGGVIGTGGVIGSGGIMGSGGKGGGGATGGTIGTGGVMGSGGSSGCTCAGVNEICQPGTTTCICSQSDSTACAGVPCGTVTNICNQTVLCPNNCAAGYVCDTTLNTCRKSVVTGCGGSVSTGTGLIAGTEAAPICPLN